jgi:hypothetical protein
MFIIKATIIIGHCMKRSLASLLGQYKYSSNGKVISGQEMANCLKGIKNSKNNNLIVIIHRNTHKFETRDVPRCSRVFYLFS